MDDSTITRVPIGMLNESSTTDATLPTTSWPGIKGYRMYRFVPCHTWTSEPLIPVASIASQPPVSTGGNANVVAVKRCG
jgi:hypothetical protein